MIYVTGGNGFIGTKLRDKLRNLDRITIRSIPHEKIMDYSFSEWETFFFLSTYGNMVHHTQPLSMIVSNVKHVERVLEWSWVPDAKGLFIYLSSSSVLLPVQTPYSRTKRAAEEIIQAMNIPSCIVRPYSVTGVGEQKEHLIPTLIRSCMEGEEMPFNPFPVHDFVDVDDVVDGLIALADKEFTGIIEFGNGRPVTNQEVREIVEDVCGKKANAKVINTPLREYDNSSWYCRKRNPLWNPKKSLRESIEEMVKQYATQNMNLHESLRETHH